MITFKRSVLAAALGCALVSTGANAAFQSFWFDADGAGVLGAFRVEENFDISALIRIQNTFTPTGPSTISPNFTFNQYGRGSIGGMDGQLLGDVLSAGQVAAMSGVRLTLSGTGTGTLTPSGGNISFNTDGLVKFYNPAYTNEIATFAVSGGSGSIDATGVPNGQSTLIAKATNFDAGYFFADNGGLQGADMSSINLGLVDVFGFTTTNLSLIGNPATAKTQIDLAFAAGQEGYITAPGTNHHFANINAAPFDRLYVNGGGQFKMDVPEPGSLALLGLGLVGLAAASRRKAVK